MIKFYHCIGIPSGDELILPCPPFTHETLKDEYRRQHREERLYHKDDEYVVVTGEFTLSRAEIEGMLKDAEGRLRDNNEKIDHLKGIRRSNKWYCHIFEVANGRRELVFLRGRLAGTFADLTMSPCDDPPTSMADPLIAKLESALARDSDLVDVLTQYKKEQSWDDEG